MKIDAKTKSWLILSGIFTLAGLILWILNYLPLPHQSELILLAFIPILSLFFAGAISILINTTRAFLSNQRDNYRKSELMPKLDYDSDLETRIKTIYYRFIKNYIEIGGVSIFDLMSVLDKKESLSIRSFEIPNIANTDQISIKIKNCRSTKDFMAIENTVNDIDNWQIAIEIVDKEIVIEKTKKSIIIIRYKLDGNNNPVELIKWILTEIDFSFKKVELLVKNLNSKFEGYTLIQNGDIFFFEDKSELQNFIED